MGSRRQPKTAAKSPYTPRVARQPSQVAERRAPPSTHTDFIAESKLKCAGSEPSASRQAMPVRPSLKPAPRPATRRRKHLEEHASNTHRQRRKWTVRKSCSISREVHNPCAKAAGAKRVQTDSARRGAWKRGRKAGHGSSSSRPIWPEFCCPDSLSLYLCVQCVSGLHASACSSCGAEGEACRPCGQPNGHP